MSCAAELVRAAASSTRPGRLSSPPKTFLIRKSKRSQSRRGLWVCEQRAIEPTREKPRARWSHIHSPGRAVFRRREAQVRDRCDDQCDDQCRAAEPSLGCDRRLLARNFARGDEPMLSPAQRPNTIRFDPQLRRVWLSGSPFEHTRGTARRLSSWPLEVSATFGRSCPTGEAAICHSSGPIGVLGLHRRSSTGNRCDSASMVFVD